MIDLRWSSWACVFLLAACGASDTAPASVPSASAGAGAAGASGAGGQGGAVTCGKPFIGDPSLPIELSLTIRGVDAVSSSLSDGQAVPLITPPQGGKVLFLGLRARNLSPCSVTITGTLRDPATTLSRVDGRVINLRATGDGWGASVDTDISTFANIPVCPNQWQDTDAAGAPFELSLALTDAQGRTAGASVTATPTCAETEPSLAKECACTCRKGYVFGQTCP